MVEPILHPEIEQLSRVRRHFTPEFKLEVAKKSFNNNAASPSSVTG